MQGRVKTTIVLDEKTYWVLKSKLGHGINSFILSLLERAYENNLYSFVDDVKYERPSGKKVRFTLVLDQKNKYLFDLIPKSKRSGFIRLLVEAADKEGLLDKIAQEKRRRKFF